MMKFVVKLLDVCFIILINNYGKILVIKVSVKDFKVIIFLVCDFGKEI